MTPNHKLHQSIGFAIGVLGMLAVLCPQHVDGIAMAIDKLREVLDEQG